jgi:hypothetical protein
MRRTFLVTLALIAACGDDDPRAEVDAARPADVLDASDVDAALVDASLIDAAHLDAALEAADAGPARDADLPFVCDVVAPSACPEPAPTYADVQPIFTRQCGVCHGQDWTGEWPLDSYSHVSDWQDEIRSELVSCSMPPRDSGVEIAPADRMKILHWLRCGLPR